MIRLFSSLLFAAALAAQERPPNVVLIMADDIGAECFTSYGGTSYATPNLDRLAARGLRFTRCYSQPLCTPSRVKLMTGRSNVRNYVAFSVLDRDEITFADVLRDAGYATCVVGKWQLLAAEHYPENIRGKGTWPAEAGFDEHCLWQVDRLGSRYWGPAVTTGEGFTTHDAQRYGPDVYCEHLLDFMTRNRKRPFLAYLPMALVHNPFQPTPRTGDGPKGGRRQENFAAMVAYMDELVGRIVAKVEELGLTDSTLVLFTGDNGTNRNIRSRFRGRTVRGGKGLTNDRGTWVPLVASWPGTVPMDRTCDDLVDFSDFMPTLAELSGGKLPADRPIDGRSFLSQLRGERGEPRESLYCWYHPRPVTRPKSTAKVYARDARWKLYSSGELYDLKADPDEQRPLPEESEGAAAGARRKLAAVIASMPAAPQKRLQ